MLGRDPGRVAFDAVIFVTCRTRHTASLIQGERARFEGRAGLAVRAAIPDATAGSSGSGGGGRGGGGGGGGSSTDPIGWTNARGCGGASASGSFRSPAHSVFIHKTHMCYVFSCKQDKPTTLFVSKYIPTNLGFAASGITRDKL